MIMKRNKIIAKLDFGFTLIELLVVIAIISLISAIVLNNVADSRMKAADTKTAEDLRNVRIAAELYYLDNKKYPDDCTSCLGLTDNSESSVLAQNSYGRISKLSFFTKTAQAAVTHTQTKLCANFDNIAQQLVQKKYLSSVPVHPYDNDAAGVCYKAKSTQKAFTSYAVLTSRIATAGGGSVSKRQGFIVGDASLPALKELGDSIEDIVSADGNQERPYPADETGIDNNFDDLSEIVDAVEGVTNGKKGTGGLMNGIFSDLTGGNNSSGGGSNAGVSYPSYSNYTWWSATCGNSAWQAPSYNECASWFSYYLSTQSNDSGSGTGDSGNVSSGSGGDYYGGSSSGSYSSYIVPNPVLSKPDTKRSNLSLVVEAISDLFNRFVK